MRDIQKDFGLGLLKELVEINSFSGNPSGVNAVQKRVEKALKKLKFTVKLRRHPADPKKSGLFLIGERKSSAKLPWITLVTHADTVFPPSSGFKKFSLSKDRKRAFGPGVIDDKGGIVVALQGMALFLETNPKKLNLRLICTPTEELGSPGYHPLLQKLSADSSIILGFEPSLDDGSIIESRRGNRWYKIEVKGREAHAGRAHALGVNAAHELVQKLDQLQKLTDYDRDATVSIASIQTPNDRYNIVCPEAEAKIDSRFSDFDEAKRLHEKIVGILEQKLVVSPLDGARAQTTYTIEDDCPPVSPKTEARELISLYLSEVEKIEGRTVRSARSHGSADCNYMNRDGIAILDGLGPTGGGLHSKDEFLWVESLTTRSQALAGLLTHLAIFTGPGSR